MKLRSCSLWNKYIHVIVCINCIFASCNWSLSDSVSQGLVIYFYINPQPLSLSFNNLSFPSFCLLDISFFLSVCELNALLLSVLNSSELFTSCENLLHFYKLFICLFTLLPPLPVLFFQLFLWPLCDFSPTLFSFFFYITLFYLSIHFLAGIWRQA